MKTNDIEQWTIASLEISAGKKHETDQKLHLITNNTIPLYHIPIAPFKVINHVMNNNIKHNTLIEIEETPFLPIEQPDLVPIPMLQKLGPQIPDVYMAVLWNPGRKTAKLKRNMSMKVM